MLLSEFLMRIYSCVTYVILKNSSTHTHKRNMNLLNLRGKKCRKQKATGFCTPSQFYNYPPKAYQSWACFQVTTYGSGFPGGSVVRNLPANAGDTGSISDPGRSPGEGNGNPLQYSCLKNPHGQRSLAAYSPLGCKKTRLSN